MPLLKILTDPQNFKFYAGGKGYVSTPDSFGQKSIPYGKDRFGGGSSKQPYIVKSININDSQVENTGGPDFLVRGGSLIPGKVADDVSRLTKESNSAALANAMFLLKIFITLGWSIYPIGYMVLPGNLLSGMFEVSSIDLFYNLADAINKIGFGLVIYSVAIAETAKAKKA